MAIGWIEFGLYGHRVDRIWLILPINQGVPHVGNSVGTYLVFPYRSMT